MPATKKRAYARYTLSAVTLLGRMIALERKTRRMTAQELADRLGVTRGTLQRLEAGDPKVEVGLAFEACALMGVRLFEEDAAGLTLRAEEAGRRLALLPKYARPLNPAVDDDF
ncbi:MAG: helix-turn-helix transcriptional regulator [Brevundimonas sp.]|uniref:helix-turn-helix transcriptional regulator n=1 Tax=Brevundimonas sp. TaxID=1871086 RepID=UPI0027324E0B|nr:helix-turn-helix transcriptional regulator [Brevundimonas sp.]MDP3403445.1 helix-turn-helix transcriptional regulator [Brevundimonas sp.]